MADGKKIRRKKRSSPENGKKAVNPNFDPGTHADPMPSMPDMLSPDNQQSPDPTDGMSLLSLPNGPTAGPLQRIHNQKMQEKHRLQPDNGTHADPVPNMPEKPQPMDEWDRADAESREPSPVSFNPMVFGPAILKAVFGGGEKEPDPVEKPEVTTQPATDDQPEVTTQPDTVDQPAATGEPDPLPKPDVSDVNEYAQQFGGAGSLSAAGGGSQPSSIETPDTTDGDVSDVNEYVAQQFGDAGSAGTGDTNQPSSIETQDTTVKAQAEVEATEDDKITEEVTQGAAASEPPSGDLSSTAESRFDAAQGMQVSSAGPPLGGSDSDIARLVDILTEIKAATEATRDAIEAMRDEGVTITF